MLSQNIESVIMKHASPNLCKCYLDYTIGGIHMKRGILFSISLTLLLCTTQFGVRAKRVGNRQPISMASRLF